MRLRWAIAALWLLVVAFVLLIAWVARGFA
jgi:hypothetical protein